MQDKNNKYSHPVNTAFMIAISVMVAIVMFGFLFQTGWAEKFMIAVGMIRPMHSQVDYYTYVKGIEYLLCVGFFVTFPVFYMFFRKKKK